MRARKITTEHLLFALAFLLALGFRFAGLGHTSLSDAEGQWALQALDLARAKGGLMGPQPGYIGLTAASFFLFSSSNFLARFWPALAGVLLVIAPYLAREWLGRKPAILLAFALAAEPSLVAASCQADGRMLAITGLVFAVVFWLRGWPMWAGIAAGFAALGGPTSWLGILAVALATWLSRVWISPPPVEASAAPARPWKEFMRGLGGTVALVGTFFLFAPGGLSGLGASLVEYYQGWLVGGGKPLIVVLVAWVGVSFLAWITGIGGLIHALRRYDAVDRWLAWWGVIQILLILVYPAREASDLAWAAVPFLAMAARWVAGAFVPIEHQRTVAGYAVLIGIMTISVYLNFIGLSSVILPEEGLLRWSGVAAGILLLLASFFLITWGWSFKVALRGMSWGIGAVLMLYTFSMSWAAAGNSVRPQMELWIRGYYPREEALAKKVIGDVSEWQTGRRDSLHLVISGFDSPSMKWVLRDYRQLDFVPFLPTDKQPAMVLTSAQPGNNLGLPVPYTGQPLVWGQQVNWEAMTAKEWLQWLVFRDVNSREGLFERQTVILWVRSDLFPGVTSANPSR